MLRPESKEFRAILRPRNLPCTLPRDASLRPWRTSHAPASAIQRNLYCSLVERPLQREIELDFVRGIAILLVVDYHSGKNAILTRPLTLLHLAHPGWMGVDIFFVLSGFLIGGLLVKEWKVKGRIDSRRFLIRRGFKIWPQYYFFLFAQIASRHRSVREL